MVRKVINRYNQTEIATEFAILANSYLTKNGYISRHRTLFYKILTSILIIIGIALSQYFKNYLSESYYSLLTLVVFFIVMTIVARRLQISNGILVGEYKKDRRQIRYEIGYEPLSNKFSVVEIQEQSRRQKQFQYNDYMDDSGSLLEVQFVDLVRNFVSPKYNGSINES